jgi:peptide/nickel transport system permease protein
VFVQYAEWVSGVAHGSLGHSYVSRRPVSKIVRDALPVTLALTVGGSCGGPTQWFTHLLMPWFTFALVFAALYVRMIRETLEEDYVGFARAKGMSEWAILRKHVLPNAFIPVVPMVTMDISRFALPTALFIETAFGLPGLGQAIRNALVRNDLPVIVGVVVVSVLVIAIVNFLGEVIQ